MDTEGAKIAKRSSSLEAQMLEALEGFESFFDHYSTQQPEHTDKGVVLQSGSLVPVAAVDHRIILDHYEMCFIDAFVRLAHTVKAEMGSPLVGFSSRTLIEMSYRQAPVVFAEDEIVSQKEKFRYKALHVLKDDLTLGEQRNELKEEYRKLRQEHDVAEALTAADTKIFESVEKSSNFKKLSKYISDVTPRPPTERLSIIHGTLNERMYTHYSEVLHSGSLVAVGMTIGDDTRDRQKILTTTLLIETTYAILLQVAKLKKDLLSKVNKVQLKTIDGEYKALYETTAQYWRKHYMNGLGDPGVTTAASK